ncbi:tail fiber assembly protein [Pseudomonas asplenii]|uniref:Phage tail assembly chaperone protein n=1 Tax=Pseudomonas asplenii TaxID=53407 RepID=A0A1H6NI35_9PSED|nr:tail fiber assembly protein [Pseudomonas fuscovaginae]SEI12651.1 Phage tail assembly chaperone protein [Pseudomonas fuscovaginae]
MKPIFQTPSLHPIIKWELIREARDTDLAASDYALMADYPLTDGERTALTAYRQSLRDIPDQGDNPDNIVWPEKPAFLK